MPPRPLSRAEQLQQLREVKSGVRSRSEQFQISENVAIFDEVTEDEYRRIARDRMKDNFVVDEQGISRYSNDVLENWEDGDDDDEETVHEDPRGPRPGARKTANWRESATTSSSASKNLPQLKPQNTIAESFKRGALAKKNAALSSPIQPTAISTKRKQEESDFMSQILVDVDRSDRAGPALQFLAKKARLAHSVVDASASSVAARVAPRPFTRTQSDQWEGSCAIPSTQFPRVGFRESFVEDNTTNNDDENGLAGAGKYITLGHGDSSLLVVPREEIVEKQKDDHYHDNDDDYVRTMDVDESDLSLSLSVRKITTKKATMDLGSPKGLQPCPLPSTTTLEQLPIPTFGTIQPTADHSTFGAAGFSTIVDPDGKLYFYLLDVVEQRNILYLFGKVKVDSGKYSSCAIAVKEMERNVFFLPRKTVFVNGQHTDTPVIPMDVYHEFDELRKKLHLKRFAGAFVKRKYAFEIPSIPSEATWVKVSYSFDEQMLPSSLEAGKTFSHVLGKNTSALELLLRKCRIMGPCWLQLSNVVLHAPGSSWCKVEGWMALKSGKTKNIVVLSGAPQALTLGTDLQANFAPSLIMMAITTKTFLNQKSQHEIMTICALTYCVPGAGTGPPEPLHHVTLVRSPSNIPLATLPQRSEEVSVHQNEKSMLNHFLANIQKWDPDVLIGHNIAGFDIELLVNRISATSGPSGAGNFSKLGRFRRKNIPPSMRTTASINRFVTSGRLVLDTYLASRELVSSSKSYSLNYLATTQLGQLREELDFSSIPRLAQDSNKLQGLLYYNFQDCKFVVGLMEKLNCLLLYKQLACLCGSLWSRTMISGRAERNEYLLLHKFHEEKFLVPDKVFQIKLKPKSTNKITQSADPDDSLDPFLQENETEAVDGDGEERQQTAHFPLNSSPASSFSGGGGVGVSVGGSDGARGELGPATSDVGAGAGGAAKQGQSNTNRKKPQYAGGLVLEPKSGFYDTYVLLLDFNSLYPSIIQEYNICFTTVTLTDDDSFPQLPEPAAPEKQGILPKLIRTLVERRKQVKALMKNCSKAEYSQYNIRQLALKLTANSMYGCLGFGSSRFYCKQLAMLITRQGREILQSTVDLANKVDMEVIYGDTDSIMISTRTNDMAIVKGMGRKLKELVNKRYRHLEIEMDGFFERLLLLKKKKYAAVVVEETSDGQLKRHTEVKGLDQVRRDWCSLSKETSEYILTQILGTDNRESVVTKIHEHLSAVSERARAGLVPLDAYVITKGLTRVARAYTDPQPHVSVALALEARGEPVAVGNTVPYVICKLAGTDGAAASLADRARHPKDVTASLGALEVDIEWYLGTQVLPPAMRVCAAIEGTSQAQLANCMGLDARRYAAAGSGSGSGGINGAFGTEFAGGADIQPLEALLSDEERFAGLEALQLHCGQCDRDFEMSRTVDMGNGGTGTDVAGNSTAVEPEVFLPRVGWACPKCMQEVPAGALVTQVMLASRRHIQAYEKRWLVCDDSSCGARSRSVRVYATRCWRFPQCSGQVVLEVGPNMLHRQLAYLSCIFDGERYMQRMAAGDDRVRVLLKSHGGVLQAVRANVDRLIERSARSKIDLGELFAFIRVVKP